MFVNFLYNDFPNILKLDFVWEQLSVRARA